MDFEQCCTECLKDNDLVNEFCRLKNIKRPDKRSPIEIQLGVTSSEDDRCVFPDSDVEFDDAWTFES